MTHLVNSRSDIESLRGSPDFETALRFMHGAFYNWSLIDGEWVQWEDDSLLSRFAYTKSEFLNEIEPFEFPSTAPPSLPPAPTLLDYKSAFDSHLDEVAQQRQYDNRLTVPSYKGSTNPQWASEADVYVAWRDAALIYMFTTLQAFQDGDIERPSVEEFIAGITPIEWP